ncbi:succinyl-diaminopimelate desuccinylase [Acidothermaceae bacterium B102]|nr:succinyl-diaminopimelate desuccinylase [Acidothermaceae bacterium B102]
MTTVTSPLDELVTFLVDTPSVSGDEAALASWVFDALSPYGHLTVERDGNAVVARTSLGLPSRIIFAGHLDTVPIADNVPSRREGDRLFGCGSTDMKGGVAVMLSLAASVTAPKHDLTYVFYDCEEVEAARNGLARVTANHPDWLVGDLAIVMEPSTGEIEAGCQGTLRVEVTVLGTRAHSARSWLGDNAIHNAGVILERLASYTAREPVVDGIAYHEGLNAVGIRGGVAGNVIPDECVVTVNYRFAPDRSGDEALAHVREVLAPYDCVLTDLSEGARPGLDRLLVKDFVAAVGREPRAKYGWTDAARFSSLGVPALNWGPGDPNLAHTRGEYLDLPQLDECATIVRAWLTT